MTYTTKNGTGISLAVEDGMLKGFDMKAENLPVCECRFENPTKYHAWDECWAQRLAEEWDSFKAYAPHKADLFFAIAHGTHEVRSLPDAIDLLGDEHYFAEWEALSWDDFGKNLFMWMHGQPDSDRKKWSREDKNLFDSVDGLIDWKTYAKKNCRSLQHVIELDDNTAVVCWL